MTTTTPTLSASDSKALTRTRSLIVQAAIVVANSQSEGTTRDAVAVLRQCVRVYAALQKRGGNHGRKGNDL